MLHLDDQTFDFSCPNCGFYNPITLKQIRLRDAIICRGCKAILNFEDHMNETRKAVRSINKELRNLEDQLNKTSVIRLNF
jgi:hypothetical protein